MFRIKFRLFRFVFGILKFNLGSERSAKNFARRFELTKKFFVCRLIRIRDENQRKVEDVLRVKFHCLESRDDLRASHFCFAKAINDEELFNINCGRPVNNVMELIDENHPNS